MSEYIEHLKKYLYERFGKDIEISSIAGTGWNPRCHVEVDIVTGGNKLRLFLKALNPERQEAEIYAYSRILPFLDIRIPRFYGSFPDNEFATQWLILERIKGRWIQPEHEGEALEMFQVIGYLHGAGKAYPPVGRSVTEQLQFPSASDEEVLSRRRDLLKRYATDLSLDEGVVEAFAQNVLYLCESPKTWIHGDNDISNILVSSDGLYVIDWEKFSWASPALDLGELVTKVPHGESRKYIEAYCLGYRSASNDVLNFDEVLEWVNHGLFFDGVRWISYYCERMSDSSWDRQNWYDSYVVPRIRIINDLMGRLVCC